MLKETEIMAYWFPVSHPYFDPKFAPSAEFKRKMLILWIDSGRDGVAVGVLSLVLVLRKVGSV